jgi:hypothetical protein
VPDPEPCPESCPVVHIKVKVHPGLDLNFAGSRQKKRPLYTSQKKKALDFSDRPTTFSAEYLAENYCPNIRPLGIFGKACRKLKKS